PPGLDLRWVNRCVEEPVLGQRELLAGDAGEEGVAQLRVTQGGMQQQDPVGRQGRCPQKGASSRPLVGGASAKSNAGIGPSSQSMIRSNSSPATERTVMATGGGGGRGGRPRQPGRCQRPAVRSAGRVRASECATRRRRGSEGSLGARSTPTRIWTAASRSGI